MLTVFSIFMRAREFNPWIVLACLTFGGFAEIASISTMLPVISSIAGGESANSSPLNQHIHGVMAAVGLAPTLGPMLILVTVFMLLKAALSFAALTYAGVSAARVSISLRRELIRALFGAQWRFYTDRQRGRFANAISNDATRAGDAYLHCARVIAYFIQALAYLAVAFLVGWQLALAGLIAGGLVMAALGKLVVLARRAGEKQTGRTSDLTVHVVDMLGNIKPLKSMQRWRSLLATMTHTLDRLKKSLVRREIARQGLRQGGDVMVTLLISAAIYAAHTLWKIPLPELVVSGLVFFQLLNIGAKLQRHLQGSAELESAYIETQKLIQAADAHQENWSGEKAPSLGGGVRFEGVRFAHGEHVVLDDLDLEIATGAVTVFMGPSGSGKTTIVDLAIGLHRADAGRILVGDDPIEAIDMAAWRRKIGYVPQELTLLHSSIRQNITLGESDIDDDAIWAALDQVDARSFVEGLPGGLDAGVGETGGKLSGGQRQRISLARALVCEPEILILDEVTSALDPTTEAAIVQNIAKLRGRYTIVAITHRPAWTEIADRLFIVDQGVVRAADQLVAE